MNRLIFGAVMGAALAYSATQLYIGITVDMPLQAQCTANQGIWLKAHMWSRGSCFARELATDPMKLAEFLVERERYLRTLTPP